MMDSFGYAKRADNAVRQVVDPNTRPDQIVNFGLAGLILALLAVAAAIKESRNV